MEGVIIAWCIKTLAMELDRIEGQGEDPGAHSW